VFAWVRFPRRNDADDVGFWMVSARSVRLGSFSLTPMTRMTRMTHGF
jgi:hypothetical protein